MLEIVIVPVCEIKFLPGSVACQYLFDPGIWKRFFPEPGSLTVFLNIFGLKFENCKFVSFFSSPVFPPYPGSATLQFRGSVDPGFLDD
jgi:hypothetical protein